MENARVDAQNNLTVILEENVSALAFSLPIWKAIEKHIRNFIPDFKVDIRTNNKVIMFMCPICKTQPNSCNVLPQHRFRLRCFACKDKTIFSLFEVIRSVDTEKATWSDQDIESYLFQMAGYLISRTSVEELFDYFEKQGFDLVPVERNSKAPFELEWTKKTHKSRTEWQTWLKNGLNIGIKTGKISGITVVDIDTSPMPPEIEKIKGKALIQVTNKGTHLIYKYTDKLTQRRFQDLKIDIRNDGGQIVVSPSMIDGKYRVFQELLPELSECPQELIDYLLSQKKDVLVKTDQETKSIEEGGRNQGLIHLGGVLRKSLNLPQTQFVLEVINRNFVSPPLPEREISTICGSLDKYDSADEQKLVLKVLNYLKMVGEAFPKDLQEALCERKEPIDKALAFLLKEGFVTKSRRAFQPVRRANWSDKFPSMDNAIKFKMPYFHETGQWNYGDLLLLGGQSKSGKTTIAVNIVKKLVEQGIKPYMMCLETGSRFVKTAIQLGLKEGDFYWDFVSDPTKIELEPNAVTILDWLLIEDKAQTDVVMRYFVEQLYKTNGFLIMFQQLKYDQQWFAPNMVSQFPALAARYLYDKDSNGQYGYWMCDFVREPLFRGKTVKIPCEYDFTTKILETVQAKQENVNGSTPASN